MADSYTDNLVRDADSSVQVVSNRLGFDAPSIGDFLLGRDALKKFVESDTLIEGLYTPIDSGSINQSNYNFDLTTEMSELQRQVVSRSLSNAKSQLGVKENSKDWSPAIAQYLKSANISFPAAWCAAFVNWSVREAANYYNIPNPIKGVKGPAGVRYYKEYYNSNNLASPVPQVGDFFVPLGAYSHIGFVLEISGEKFRSIEGNWGNKVAMAYRRIDSCYYFKWWKLVK